HRKRFSAELFSGCRNWKKALSVFSKHDMAQSHKDSVLAWKGYQATIQQGDVVQMMTSANAHEIGERRECLKQIFAVSSMLGAHGLPFCGNDERVESANRGIFLACMGPLVKFDPFLQNHNRPSNATNTSPVSQNEMIECCAQEVTSVIVPEIKHSKMYSIMADEAKDGRSEQLAVCVRYVSEGEVKERFLALSELISFDAKSIVDKLQHHLQINGLANVTCIAQTYDGAAVMSGTTGVVHAHFRRLHPEAVYVHCYAHKLNLVLCHTCRAVSEAVELFDLLECTYSFFTTPLVNHHKFKDAQSKLGLAAAELLQLANTRWACRLQSINAVLQTLPAIFECLSDTGSTMAIGIKGKLSVFSTIYALLMFQTLLSITEGRHKLLQKEDIDLAEALIGKDAVCDTIRGKRTDAFATELYERTKALCLTHGIPEPHAKRRQKQKKVEDLMCETTVGSRTELISSEVLKTELLFPCVDRMVGELEVRFCSVDAGLLKGIQACSPKSENFLDQSNLNELARHYSINLKIEEVLVARNFFSVKADAGHSPQDSCSCERSFSALRWLHTWLRQTMGQRRLHNLAVMSIENDLVGQLSDNKVIDRFATMKNRRHSLMLPPSK
uniref:DUF4371 domain-containing protein n=1 Tax=Nothobranchius furzeri TaxID=105023 RepID=A0A8C6M5P9_NOTFU